MKLLQADVARSTLRPLTDTRSVSDIEIGGRTVFQHIEQSLEAFEHHVLTPEYLEDITRKNSELYGVEREVNPEIEDEYILYNSAVIPDETFADRLEELEKGQGFFDGETFIAGKIGETVKFEGIDHAIQELERNEIEAPMKIEYPWEVVDHNSELIERSFPGGEIRGELSDDAVVKGSRERIYIGEDAVVGVETEEGVRGEVIIDTTEGSVIIDDEAQVGPNTRITGPAYVGSSTKVGAGDNAVIHEGTHIGDVARAGGEIEGAVIHSFSNKYHHGFLGDSVVGSWANFGAGTTNSDLKNTYGTVRVDLPGVKGRESAGQFFGTVIGDHSKMGIGTRIYTGKLVGPVAQVHGEVEQNTGAFAWKSDEIQEYDPEKAAEHAERMMERRKDHLPAGYIETQRKLILELAEKQ
jgi:UDP-N-acetylglucosamine diphosphorylase/glucosamine-1-phosphate N-acetyltransferase